MKDFIRKNKGMLMLSSTFIILFIGLAFLDLNVTKQQAIRVNKESLQVLANEKAAQVNMFLESQKEKLTIIGSMNVFKEAVLYPNNQAKIKIAQNRIDELNDVVHRIAIFTNEGMMFIAESGPVPIDYSTLPYFVSKDKNIIFMRYYDNYRKQDYYSILGPIYDGIEKDKVIGAIAFNIELDEISALMKETVESETKEVYLIDETGLLLSGSEYIGTGDKKGVLVQEIKSDEAKACLDDLKEYGKDGAVEEHEEEVIQYTNYMGNEVFGAHAYVPSIMGCVIAENSVNEVSKSTLTGLIISEFNKNEVKK